MSEPNLTATAELIALGVPEAPRRLPNLNRAPFEIRALKSGFPVSYTHLDVYKRQHQRKIDFLLQGL